MNPSIDPTRCPLCGLPNDCQLCTAAAHKGPCWCLTAEIPAELIARVPPELRNKSCICRECVMNHHRQKASRRPAAQQVLPEDFYFEHGLIVFTAEYHLRRGYCCGGGCRHCPYRNDPHSVNAKSEA